MKVTSGSHTHTQDGVHSYRHRLGIEFNKKTGLDRRSIPASSLPALSWPLSFQLLSISHACFPHPPSPLPFSTFVSIPDKQPTPNYFFPTGLTSVTSIPKLGISHITVAEGLLPLQDLTSQKIPTWPLNYLGHLAPSPFDTLSEIWAFLTAQPITLFSFSLCYLPRPETFHGGFREQSPRPHPNMCRCAEPPVFCPLFPRVSPPVCPLKWVKNVPFPSRSEDS